MPGGRVVAACYSELMRLGFVFMLLTAAAACAPLPSPVTDLGPAAPIIEHVAKQEVLTPLPLRVRLPASYAVEHVLVLVLTWGSDDWQVVELDRRGQTWSGEVSCRQVSTVTGDTRYFFLALDHAGEVVAGSGSPNWPHVATVVGSLPGGAQGLDGEAPPGRCHDVADCPPDFPGCPAYALLRPPCSTSDDCRAGSACEWDGYCSADPRGYEGDEWDVFEDDVALARAIRRAKRQLQNAKVSRPGGAY